MQLSKAVVAQVPTASPLLHRRRRCWHPHRARTGPTTRATAAALGIAARSLHHHVLQHVVHGPHGALGPLYLATFCALSVTLGALSASLFSVLAELRALQQQREAQTEPRLLHGVDVSGSAFFRDPDVLAAVAFAAQAHAGQARKTGEPYVAHCIEAALIVERSLPAWRTDVRHKPAVMAAVLHDVLDDTPTEAATLAELFGPQVATMVATVSQLSRVNQLLRRDKRRGMLSTQPEYWASTWQRLKRMMFEVVTREPLVILIKLADRLHNMRTVWALPAEKQLAVAEETLEVWCSMAEYLGWDAIKSEMEDLCFAVCAPDTYCTLRQQLDRLWATPQDSRRRRMRRRAAQLHAAEQLQVGAAAAAAAAAAAVATAATAAAAPPPPAVPTAGDGGDSADASNTDAAGALGSLLPPPPAPLLDAPAPGSCSAPLRVSPLALPPFLAGVTDAAVSFQNLFAAPPEGAPSPLLLTPPPPPAAPPLPRFTPQQEQLRAVLSTVVPFDAVCLRGSGAASLCYSARQGLAELDACAGRLYEEISVGSFGGGLDVTIQGRLKSVRSVARKMQRKRCALEEVYDARALRVIVDDAGGERIADALAVCYRLVAAVHQLWRPVPREFDDYISNPKPSGYQSLHTAVWGPSGVAMEVQIKTSSMHEHAELGGAAHFVYKEVMRPPGGPATQQSTAAAAPAPPVTAFSAPPPSAAPPAPRPQPRCYAGQPVLRISARLRYGVVLSADGAGGRLLVCVLNGSTFQRHPLRMPDYTIYGSMLAYARRQGWHVPGQGDLHLRLEEFVLCGDGRFRRKDHLAYTHPNTTLTLLEGYEEAAAAHSRAASALANSSVPTPALQRQSGQAAAEGEGADGGGAASVDGAAPGSAWDERPWAETAAKAAQLRNVIEWGAAAYGSLQEAAPSHEISVVIWPGGGVVDVPRGTTAGQVVRQQGLLEVVRGDDESADGGSRAALLGASGATRLVNVNNRLVSESTVLGDGDLVILARETVRI